VRLTAISRATLDFRDMLAQRLTFAQALARDNDRILLVQKSRLFRVRGALWPQIENVI
jgi:hypothetical protein